MQQPKARSDKRTEFKQHLNELLRAETVQLFGNANEIFDTAFERIQRDSDAYDAWLKWKRERLPRLRMLALRHIGEPPTSYDVYAESRELAHLRHYEEQPQIRIAGKSLAEWRMPRAVAPVISLKEFKQRFQNGQYQPSGKLLNGQPVTKQSVSKGLGLDVTALKKELEHLAERAAKYEALDETTQVKYIEVAREIWARQAQIEDLLEALGG